MGRRRFNTSDPTYHQAIANITRQGKLRAPRTRNQRRIVQEFPHIFRGLNEAEKATITLAAARMAGVDAWGITAEHLEKAKANCLRRGEAS